jgi:hypothetical protein
MGGGQSSTTSETNKLGNTSSRLDALDIHLDDTPRESKYPLQPFTFKTIFVQINGTINIPIQIKTPGLTVDWLYQSFLLEVWNHDK